MRNRLLSPGLAALVFTALCGNLPAAEAGFTGGLKIILYNALFTDTSGEDARNIILDVEAEEGRWGRVYGMALSFNQGDHYGFVEEAAVEGDAFRLKVIMIIGRDNWISGGDAVYAIDLKRAAGGRLEGSYEGTFRGVKFRREAAGEIKPPRPVRLKDYRPLDGEEHPRLLFRKSDLPALKAKLQTPFGQAFLERARAGSDDLVCLGMLYQFTGEAQYAERARKIIEGYKGDLSPEGGAGTGGVGHQFVAVVMAYDMCCQAWPEDFRKELNENILNHVLYMQRSLSVAGANFNPCSNYYGPGRGAPAIASLVLYGDKGPEPRKPLTPEEIAAKGGLAAKLMAKSGQLDKYQADYPRMLAQWRTEHDEWSRAGGADLNKLNAFYAGFIQMNRHYRIGVGDGGFQAETGGYADIATYYPLVYAACYLKMFGRDASAFPDITHLMPRRMMQVVFGEKGPAVLKINSAVGFRPDWCAVAFPIVPDQWKPALLWAWNRVAGVTDEASAEKVLAGADQRGLHLAHKFLHYPLDMKPEHPSKVMPLTWEAPTLGYYCFRSGWEGKDEFVGQVFLKAQPIGGWNHPNGGTFRLYGLGHAWATGVDSRAGFREQENVVLLPEDKVSGGSCGRLASLQKQPDGSGALTIDMTDIYGTTRPVANPRQRGPQNLPGGIVIEKDSGPEDDPKRTHLYDANGVRMAENWADSGVTGLRAIAFDYSGRSGAPCMMALVDKVAGGKSKVWAWQMPHEGGGHKVSKPKVAIEGNAFTLDYGDASLKATFVAPAGVKIERVTEEANLGKHGTKYAFEGALDYIKATGDEGKAGDFFVVVTVQRKDGPEVKIEGAGLESRVNVGGPRGSFDGKAIVLGP